MSWLSILRTGTPCGVPYAGAFIRWHGQRPGSGGGRHSDGRLFALDSASGAVRWNVRVSGEVLAPAVISERLIALRTVDGRLHALSLSDGHELWSYEQQVPKLSLRALRAGDRRRSVVVRLRQRQGGGREYQRRSMQWEATVAPPTDAPSSRRLDDIDSPVSVSGRTCSPWGSRAASHARARYRQVWWSHDASSYRGLTLEGDVLYLVSADGEVVACARAPEPRSGGRKRCCIAACPRPRSLTIP